MPAEDDYNILADMAERMGHTGEAAAKMINDGMKGLGYKPSISWADPDPEGGDKESNLFSQSQRRGPGRPPARKKDSSDWQYGS